MWDLALSFVMAVMLTITMTGFRMLCGYVYLRKLFQRANTLAALQQMWAAHLEYTEISLAPTNERARNADR